MENQKLKIKYMAPGDLVPWDKNPKLHNEQAIEASVEKFGIRQPIIVQKGTNKIIAGHGRLEAFKAQGSKEVPVLEWDCSDEEAAEFALADNQTTIMAGWDQDLLGDVLQDLAKQGIDTDWLEFDVQGSLEDIPQRPGFDDIIDRFGEKRAGDGDNLYFYVEYYGQPERFEAIKKALEKKGLLVGGAYQHDLDPDKFSKFILGE